MSEREDAMRAFLKNAGWESAAVAPLPGDASTRRYFRADLNGRKAMVMDQPQHAETPVAPANATPEQRRALGYNAVARLAGADVGRFVAASNYLRQQGLTAPEIYAADVSQGFALIEDLGHDLYADVLNDGGDADLLYGAAIDALAKLHAHAAPASLADKPLHQYDETALIAETDLLPEWFFPVGLGRNATDEEFTEHRALWKKTLDPVFANSSVFVHRDYHAQNLLWLPEREGYTRVGIIDFQDAVAGTHAYDLVSLVEDARRDVDPALAERMTAHYLKQMASQGTPLVESEFRAQAAIMAAQRNAKIVGIFARLYKRDNKPRYLDYLPRVWGYLNKDLEHPALRDLKTWYAKHIPQSARGKPQGVSV
jgi:aminoglycoside/choline kinase family phosphotransferase